MQFLSFICLESIQYKIQKGGGEIMRGKLRDKRDVKHDRLKRDMMGRKPAKKDNRNLHFVQSEDEDDYLLDEEENLKIAKEQRISE